MGDLANLGDKDRVSGDAAPPPSEQPPGNAAGFQLTTASGKTLPVRGAGMEEAKRLIGDIADIVGGRDPPDGGLSGVGRPHPSPGNPMVGRPGSARTPLAQIRNHGLGGGVSRFARENGGPAPSRLGPAGRPSGQKAKSAFKAPRTNRKFQSPVLAAPGSAPQVSYTCILVPPPPGPIPVFLEMVTGGKSCIYVEAGLSWEPPPPPNPHHHHRLGLGLLFGKGTCNVGADLFSCCRPE